MHIYYSLNFRKMVEIKEKLINEHEMLLEFHGLLKKESVDGIILICRCCCVDDEGRK